METITDQCWLWDKSTSKGYGTVWYEGRVQRVHRLTYEAIIGPIPDGLVIDHLCNVKHCYNPFHMRVCTQGENARRTPRLTVTHCSHGHEYNDENLYLWNGFKHCRICEGFRQGGRMARPKEGDDEPRPLSLREAEEIFSGMSPLMKGQTEPLTEGEDE